MKNANPRGIHNLNRRKESSIPHIIAAIIIAILAMIAFACTPTREVNRVIDGQGNIYTLVKKGNKVIAAKNGKPYRVSYLSTK